MATRSSWGACCSGRWERKTHLLPRDKCWGQSCTDTPRDDLHPGTWAPRRAPSAGWGGGKGVETQATSVEGQCMVPHSDSA